MGSSFPRSEPPSDPSRRGRLIFWLALAGVFCLFPLFFFGGPAWNDGPFIQTAWNLGHPIFFALLTIAVRPWRFISGWKLWASTSAVVVLLGLGIEFAQSFTARGIDGRDMFRNLTGLWAILALRRYLGFQRPYPVRDWLIRIFAVGLLSIDVIAVTHIAIQQMQISRSLPDLYDFQQDQPEQFWRGNIARHSGDDCGPMGDNALSIALSTRRFSGASLDNLPSDWRGYETLIFVLWNPQDQPIPLTLRINDIAHEQGNNKYHDRFNRSFQIMPGINRIQQNLGEVATAPEGRQMDMGEIRRLMLFTSSLSEPGHLCLGELRLGSGND